MNADKRWRDREQRWVAPGRVFDPKRFAVDVIRDDTPAKRFTIEHHYSASFPASRLNVGLYGPGAQLVGVAVFSQPMTNKVLTKHAGNLPACELGRFVCLPEVAYNGETWMLARAFRFLREEKGIAAVVSFADPLERRNGALLIKPAHYGTIYQASNALYVGRSWARWHLIGPNGLPLSPRALTKLKGGKGQRYAEKQLTALNLPERRHGESPRSWLKRLVAMGALRRQRHPGNHTYVFGLTDGARNELRTLHPERLAYPKRKPELWRAA